MSGVREGGRKVVVSFFGWISITEVEVDLVLCEGFRNKEDLEHG